MSENNKALSIFCKYPEKGKVKTRISQTTNEEFAVQLYTYLLEKIAISVNLLLNKNKNIDIYYFIDNKEKINDFINIISKLNIKYDNLHKIEIQTGNSLADKMLNAFGKLFSSNYEDVIIIGSDIVGNLADNVNNGFSLLNDNDIVIGPSYDGGFYLIGAKNTTNIVTLFDNIIWSTEYVYEILIKNIENKKYLYHILDKLYDIDTVADIIDASKKGLIKNSILTEVKKYLTYAI